MTAQVAELGYLPTGEPGRSYPNEDVDTINVAYPPLAPLPRPKEELHPITPPWLR